MANKNLLASAVLLCTPFILYALTKTKRLWTVCASAALTVSLALIVVSSTRAVWVALAAAIVGAAVLAALLHKGLRNPRQAAGASRRGLRAAVIVAVLVAVGGGIYLAGRDDLALVKRAKSITSMKDRSVRDRVGVWENSLAMSAENPVLGVGPGEWRTHISGYGNVGLRSESGVIHFQRPHNDYLWVLTETGIAGSLAYLLVFVMALAYVVAVLRASTDRLTITRGLILIYGLISYMVVAFFSYPRERIFHSMLLMLMLAIATASYHHLKPVRRKLHGVALKTVLAVAAGIVVLGLTAGSLRVASEQHLNRAYAYREMGRWEEVIKEIDLSQTFFMSMDPMSTPLAWYRGVAEFSLGRHDSALVDFQRAFRVNPTHIHVLNNLATAYEVKGNHGEAIRLFERVLEISPHFDETLLNLAAVYYNTGEFEKAYERISRVSPDCADDRYRTFMDMINKQVHRQKTDR
jgi:tetratricopeptide (TPR) repeat protein